MRALITAAVVAVFLTAAGAPVFAQKVDPDRGESEYYYVNKSLEKIYPYRNGYIVVYRKGINQMDRAYIPMSWFTDAGSKGEIITLPKGNVWPSLTVYYKDGEFSHVRLYVHRSPSHQTWGVVPQNVDLDDRFDNVESLELKF